MSPFLLITIVVTLLAAVCAMSLRNLVHCALMLAVSFSGVAAVYLQLDAEFVGFTEILVYVGAIAILIVMAILLTRSGETSETAVLTPGRLMGVVIAAAVFTALGWAILSSSALPKPVEIAPQTTVKEIGNVLMTKYVLPLEIIALMLTAAMIGAVVIAFKEELKVDGSQREETQTKIGNRQSPIGNQSEPLPAASFASQEGGAL